MTLNFKNGGENAIELNRFKNACNRRAHRYKKLVFLNPKLAPWDRTDVADAHSRLFKFLIDPRKINSELSICKFYSEWSRRSKLIPASASFFSSEKSMYGLAKESKFLTVCKDWAKKKNLCVVQIAACIVYHHLYASKKLGQENHNTVNDAGLILVALFLHLIYPKDKGFQFNTLESYSHESLGYANYEEMRLDQQEFAYFFIKTFEELGFMKRMSLDLNVWNKVTPGYNPDLQQMTLFPSKHVINCDWHNLDNTVLVRLINDPKVYEDGRVLFEPLGTRFLRPKFEEYVSFCKGQMDCLRYEESKNNYRIDKQRTIDSYVYSEYLLEQYLDYLILMITYRTCNNHCEYLIDGVEYDTYFLNLYKQ